MIIHYANHFLGIKLFVQNLWSLEKTQRYKKSSTKIIIVDHGKAFKLLLTGLKLYPKTAKKRKIAKDKNDRYQNNDFKYLLRGNFPQERVFLTSNEQQLGKKYRPILNKL